ncbi:MAG: response regulator, partial [Planctomycetes bacterium]|nr:response regulator [Planctomycetota bacterium]
MTTTRAGMVSDDNSILDGLRVLVADDYPVNQKVARKMLEKLGIEPIVVDDGQAAVEAFQGAEFDLVLMDCQMPVLDGFGATRAIREFEAEAGRKHTPVLAMTAYSTGKEQDEAREAGMDGWIEKPI